MGFLLNFLYTNFCSRGIFGLRGSFGHDNRILRNHQTHPQKYLILSYSLLNKESRLRDSTRRAHIAQAFLPFVRVSIFNRAFYITLFSKLSGVIEKHLETV